MRTANAGTHTNSQGERIEIRHCIIKATKEPCTLLILHDDPKPKGSGIAAPMLLDESTVKWLREALKD